MKKKICILTLIAICFFIGNWVQAAPSEEMKMTITPPLIKNNMNPGENWASAIKVVNNAVNPISVYAQVVDFKSREDGAGPEFIQSTDNISPEMQHYLLSQWLDVEKGPYEIPAQQSVEIPFSINLPETAEPGGHYAAILIGNRSEDDISGSGIKVSSQLASLIMINIKGDIKESGSIREFSSDKTLYKEPNVNFTVKFENNGNIHLQPQGEIGITDMFGKKKESILINQSSDFGNVLPDSSRTWNFTWQGEGGLLKMGRYRADLVLNYGSQAKETIDQTLYFWVLDIKLISLILGGILLLIIIIVWLIKRSIKKAVIASTQNLVEPDEDKKSDKEDGLLNESAGKNTSSQKAKTIDLRSLKK